MISPAKSDAGQTVSTLKANTFLTRGSYLAGSCFGGELNIFETTNQSPITITNHHDVDHEL
jgi:hypothetical protein